MIDDMSEAGRAQRLLGAALPDGLVNLPNDATMLMGFQRRLTALIDAVHRLKLIDQSTAVERAWLESCSGPTAGAFLRICPGLIGPSVRMSPREFTTTCLRRLFLPLPELAHTSARAGLCPALPAAGGRPCTRACDNRGAHLTTCATGGGAVIIHDTVNDALANFGFRQVYPPNLVLSKRPEIREHLLQKFGLARDAQLPFPGPTPDVMTLSAAAATVS